ncbi:MAG: 1-acyl-sn-glycerol-3-phosphate acyltransferase, partial [Nitrospirae bacterium]
YDDTEWYRSSLDVLRLLERVGIRVSIEGLENLQGRDTPCVFVGNHMSTFETFVLPVIILPFKPVTFVVKQSLVEYPVFKHIMISREPVVVTRKNPREDLTRVLKEGTERLSRGVSVIIFPQTTRSNDFDPSEFNTIGIKLARRASVPVIPVALKTDAWGCGRIIKDFGKIRPELDAHFAFGEPMMVSGRGTEEHKRVIEFISSHLAKWKG